jgi:hypothetical protein
MPTTRITCSIVYTRLRTTTTEIVDPVSKAASRCLVARRAARWSEPKLDADAGAGQHVDEGLDAEQLDLSADKVADAGLGYSEELRGGVLRQLACLDQALQFRHQLSAQPKAFGLLRSEPKVFEHVSG